MCGLSSAPERQQVVLGVPPLEDVDPTRVKRIGGLNEVKASGCLPGPADDARVRGKEVCSIDRRNDQVAGDNQHERTLGD